MALARLAAFALAAVSLGLSQTPDAAEIVQRAFEADTANEEIAKQYTYRERVEERKLDKNHELKESSSKTFDVLFLYGEEYERQIEENDQPLAAKAEQKERRKLDKRMAELADESEKARAKRLEKKRKDEEDQRKMRREIVQAFDFTLEGMETIDSVETYRIRADPKPGYEPQFDKAKFLGKLRGMLWIAKDDHGWVKVEMEAIDSVSFGLFLLKLKEGAEISFGQKRVNDEVWLVDEAVIRFDAKVAALKTLRREIVIDWSDFRKFSAESRLVAATGDDLADGDTERSPGKPR